jgi:hypothetical protein
MGTVLKRANEGSTSLASMRGKEALALVQQVLRKPVGAAAVPNGLVDLVCAEM